MKKKIDAFVKSFSDTEVQRIFEHYDAGGYDHLLSLPRRSKTIELKRRAIHDYLNKYIIDEAKKWRHLHREDWEINEREKKFPAIVNNMNKKEFICMLKYDQFFEEPLMHTLNQGKANYDL